MAGGDHEGGDDEGGDPACWAHLFEDGDEPTVPPAPGAGTAAVTGEPVGDGSEADG